MARVLACLIFAFTLLIASIKSSTSSTMAKAGCRETCGDLIIPYPFGIGTGCFYGPGFDVSCEDNRAFMHNSSTRVQIYDISLLGGQARINTFIASKCYGSHTDLLASTRTADLFTLSSKANKLTAVGCSTLAFLGGYNEHRAGAGCFSMCLNKQSVDHSGQCSGMGCCQTSIAPNLTSLTITFDERYNNDEVYKFNPCSYAFLAEEDSFKFEASYLEDKKLIEKFKDGVPTVVDWVAGRESCDEAVKNISYACISENSQCIKSPNATGYLCSCSKGFAGNPYLADGCQDINECQIPDQYPCNGTCTNTIGDYQCSCPSGSHSIDPKRETCRPDGASERAKLTKTFIGISSCAAILLICSFALVIECQKKKLIREKDIFFQQNGGILLYEQIRSKQIDTVRIFTTEELKHATNNFDSSREVGKGGYDTVYKGTLKDNRVVAIKRSKIMNMVQKDDFVQEMIILSQINHRNIVRLLGCCLEVEAPMLVYEFIPNGILFDLIHGIYRRSPISLDTRLRIAQESAEALAYLHSSASPPIVHGDVKSLNILLGDNYIAKVTDFGASRMLAKDEIQFMTMVQGTLGYLDPEYLQERQLTEKSDVYSFGVVLLELVTRKTAIYSESTEEKKSLASSFLMALKENKLQSILDRNILGVGIELLQEVAQLAKCCLSMKGEERPLMIEVSERLRHIRRTWREQMIEHTSDEIEYLSDYSKNYHPSSTGQHISLMTLDLETGR